MTKERQRCFPCIYIYLYLASNHKSTSTSFSIQEVSQDLQSTFNVNLWGIVVLLRSGPRAALPYVLPNIPLDSSRAWLYISFAVTDRTKLGLAVDFVCVLYGSWLPAFTII